MDYIELGTTPYEEDCTQVSRRRDYLPRMRVEARVFKRMLERLFPVPDGVPGEYRIKSNPHDFGTYLEVVAVYDPDDERSCEWAFTVEANTPARWDRQAFDELLESGYFTECESNC